MRFLEIIINYLLFRLSCLENKVKIRFFVNLSNFTIENSLYKSKRNRKFASILRNEIVWQTLSV